jgi:hypothetical protein
MSSDRPDWRAAREIREHENKVNFQRAGVPEREAAKMAKDITDRAVRRAMRDHEEKNK